MKALLLSTALLGSVCLSATGAAAQDFPNQPIVLVVPVAPGGPTDTIARIIARHMPFKQPTIVENRPGGGGTVAGDSVSRARPDGHTITIGLLGTHVLNAAIADVRYDVVEDFEPIAVVADSPQFIVSNLDVPAKNLQELIDYMKGGETLNFGTPGVGSAAHVSSLEFMRRTGTTGKIVHYRGGALAKQDMLAGNIQMMIDLAGNSLPQVLSGDIRAYAVTSPERMPYAPDVPTTAEAGLEDFQVSVWHGFFAPKDTPDEIVAQLNEAVRTALASPEVVELYAGIGQSIPPVDQQTPQALHALQVSEIERWWPVIREAGIGPQ